MDHSNHIKTRSPGNKGKLTGQKPPFRPKEIWAIRIRLQISLQVRDLAMFNLAIDSKLRSCDLVKIRVRDITLGATIARRAMVMQQKTGQPVQFEITEQTRDSISNWINHAELMSDNYLFKSRNRLSRHISTRQYARRVNVWVKDIGLDPAEYGTHSLRRTKASLIYRRTRNLRAVQILLGHRKWRALSDTWASRWMIRLRWQNRLKFNQLKPGGTVFGRFLVLQSGHLRTLHQRQSSAH